MDPEYRKQKINEFHQEIRNAEDKIKNAQSKIDSIKNNIDVYKDKIALYEKNNYWVEVEYPEFNLMNPQFTRKRYHWFENKDEAKKFMIDTIKDYNEIKSISIQNKPFFE